MPPMRRRAGTAARLVVAFAVALAAAGCGSGGDGDGDGDGGTPTRSAAVLEPACPAPTAPPPQISADLINQRMATSKLPAWQAADIGASARLSDGRLVWVFGDTVRTSSFNPRIVANSMLISSGDCVSQVRTPGDGPVIPDVSNGVVLWPMSVVVLPPVGEAAGTDVQDVLVVLCARTQRGGSGGDLDFAFLGTSAAVFTVAGDGGVPQLQKVIEITPDDSAKDQVNWGAAATLHGDWYYAYGTRLPDEPGVFGRELYVARAPVDDPGNQDKWRFWDGSHWGKAQGDAVATLPAVGGVSQTLSVSHVDGQYVAVSKRDGDLGDFVYIWTAPTPAGPWTARQGVAAPSGVDTGELEYAPLAHPEVPLTDGRLLVSISRNTTDFQQLMDDPEVGRPVFVEVERP